MASNKVDIFNLALQAIGESTLVQSETDGTTSCEMCVLQYPACLKSMLEQMAWPFATRQAAMTAAYSEWDSTVTYAANTQARWEGNIFHSVAASNLDHEPTTDSSTYWILDYPCAIGWGYVYLLPSDHLRPIAVLLDGQRIGLYVGGDKNPFELMVHPLGESTMLCCDVEPDDLMALEYVAYVDIPSFYPQLFVDALVLLLASKLALVISKDPGKSSEFYRLHMFAMSQAASVSLMSSQRDPEPSPSSIRARE